MVRVPNGLPANPNIIIPFININNLIRYNFPISFLNIGPK